MLTKDDLTLDRIRQPDMLLLDALSGSHAYGTNTPESDEDFRGVFIVPDSFHVGLDHIEQVNDAKNDQTYYELTRFFQLLLKNNPTVMELLYVPNDCVRYKHPILDQLDPAIFLSKLCCKTFAGYAAQQIKKARGLNKKIINPEPEQRRHLREFCHVLEGQGSVPLADWLTAHGLNETECGLVSVNHATNTFAIFHSTSINYRGIFTEKDDATVLCSSVPKGESPIGWLHANIDGFKKHCRLHKEYWTWVRERNEARYRTNSEHGRGYDSKNMMHTIRLLDTALEIAEDRRINVRRPNADYLLEIRHGTFSYEELLDLSEQKLAKVESAFEQSNLPETPDQQKVANLLRELQLAFTK